MINFIDALTYDKEMEQPAGKGCGINLININAQRRSRRQAAESEEQETGGRQPGWTTNRAM